jgi:hypothetical protein
MVHRMNLVVQSFLSMPMVSKLKNLFQLFYEYHSNSKFQKLAEIMKIKSLKIL